MNPLLFRLLQRRQTLLWPLVKWILAIAYSSFFIYAVFFARRRRGLTKRILNPVPLINTIENFFGLSLKSNNELYEFGTNFLGNIVLFIPVSFILISSLRIRTFSNVLLASFIISFFVETMQFFFKRGVADVDDILLNTLGAYLGFFLHTKLFPQLEETDS